MDTQNVDALAQVVWDYHLLHQPLRKADCIFVLGSNDIRVAEYAVDLFFQGYAPVMIFSGGSGILTKGLFRKSEAETFADIARQRDVPEKKIIIEDQSTNTGENIELTKRLLKERGLEFSRFLVIQKPHMERRTFATFKKLWPEKECMVTSPPIPFDHYPTKELTKDRVISIMVGDLQRIKVYGDKGFQIPQEIPSHVWSAYEKLVGFGYTEHLIQDV